MTKSITSSFFGNLASGEQVVNYALRNANGIELEVLNYGGIIRKLKLPNRNGIVENCVLGFDSLEEYVTKSPYFGAIIGRFGNRIAHGSFKLDNETFSLVQNLGEHHLHGGIKGFDKVIWTVEEIHEKDAVALKLTHHSPHLEEGYPGNLRTTVTYRLSDEDALEIDFKATTDRTTLVNLTQHSYFNLSGQSGTTILDHELQLSANKLLDVDQALIPTGGYYSVENTPFDFNQKKTIGQDIFNDHPLLGFGQGYDHCYCFDSSSAVLKKIASLSHPNSGRQMDVYTTAPAMQLYTANHLNPPFVPHQAVCLETQGYPDSPNHENFPSAILTTAEEYHTRTEFKFTIV